jgi:hypothetical protein
VKAIFLGSETASLIGGSLMQVMTIRDLQEGKMPRKYNETKRRVLSVLEARGWLTPQMIKSLSGFRGTAIAWYLNRLGRFGLLHRRGAYRGRVIVFRISARGKRRLAWLRSRESQTWR